MFTYYPHAINKIGMDFTKEFFQNAWGEGGYYENFSYGVGIDNVCKVSLYPFFNSFHTALEVGPGGGVFTKRMIGMFDFVTAIDVIKMPEQFKKYPNFKFIELPDQSYNLPGIPYNSIDFCFCYNVFCHLSNTALLEYIRSARRVLKLGGNFVFMLSRFIETKKHLKIDTGLKRGDLTSTGHYYQDEKTLNLIIIQKQWEVISRDLIPEHRDNIIHLKAK